MSRWNSTISCRLTLDGDVVAGERSPTSEKALHLATMAAHPEVGGVVHCHARYASMFAVAHQPIPAAIDEFVTYIGGDVPVCEYHESGRDSLGVEVSSKLGDRSAALMANHGLVAVGKSVDDALHSALVVEHNAQIMWGAQMLGGVQPLPDSADQELHRRLHVRPRVHVGGRRTDPSAHGQPRRAAGSSSQRLRAWARALRSVNTWVIAVRMRCCCAPVIATSRSR